MKVELSSVNTNESTPNQIIDTLYVSARTCYSKKTPIEIEKELINISKDKKLKLIEHVISSGHFSILYHTSLKFLICGVSRTLSHQLVRHSIGINFSQQSQRYCKFDDSFEYVVPPTIKGELKDKFIDFMKKSNELYNTLTKNGIEAEDARFVLPNACSTNLYCSCNLKELIHLCNERLCTLSQWEIRKMVQLMREEVIKILPFMDKYLVPKCKAYLWCPESKERTCGLMPQKDRVTYTGSK